MTLQTPEEIVKELLLAHHSPKKAMEVLDFAIRKSQQAVYSYMPNPQLTYMNYAYRMLFSMNYGRHYYE